MSDLLPVLDALVAEHAAGRRCVLCAVVAKKGSTPQPPGAALLVREDRTTVGTLGGGCVEAEVIRRAHKESLATGEARRMAFVLNHDWGWDDGLICGGRMEIAVMPIAPTADVTPYREAIAAARARREAWFPLVVAEEGRTFAYRIRMEAPPTLLIAGAGHVGQALARLATSLDFHVVVVDDREDYASAARFPAPIERVTRSIPAALADWPIDAHTYVVIVTRGHQNDQRALEAVIHRPAAYIGLIGSERKRRLIFDDLIRQGVAPERLDAVHSPIGLPIHAVTVPEIAVSIAAELIQHRRATPPVLVDGPHVIGAADRPPSGAFAGDAG